MNIIEEESDYPYSCSYERENAGAIDKRRNEICAFLVDFIEVTEEVTNQKLKLICNNGPEEAAKIITESYFKIIQQFKPFVVSHKGDRTRLNIYKVISGLELAICEVRPFMLDNQAERCMLNAQLAYYVGKSFLTGVKYDFFSRSTFEGADNDEKSQVKALIDEHIDWLAMLQGSYHLPFFSNSHTWWALHLLLQEFDEKKEG